MRLLPVAALAAGLSASAWAQPSGNPGILNLSCVEALAAVDAGWLSGVFAFVPEKDSALAFADMVVRNKTIRRKYVARLLKDHAQAGGITTWDHEVVMQVLGIYSSPMAKVLEKPDPTTQDRLNTLSMAPTMTLAEISGKRKGG